MANIIKGTGQASACPFSIGDIMSMKSEAPEQQHAFYHTAAWLSCRASYLASVGGLCERCYAKGIVRPARVVHHKKYISLDNITDPSVLLSFDNLEALCFDCHQREHFPKQKRYRVDEFGNVTTKAE